MSYIIDSTRSGLSEIYRYNNILRNVTNNIHNWNKIIRVIDRMVCIWLEFQTIKIQLYSTIVIFSDTESKSNTITTVILVVLDYILNSQNFNYHRYIQSTDSIYLQLNQILTVNQYLNHIKL